MINSFINQPDESLTQISGPAPAYQSFTERKKLERQRRIVKGYRDSLLGSAYGARGKVQPGERDVAAGSGNTVQRMPSRQEMNATASPIAKVSSGPGTSTSQRRGFSEPPTRSYNPYG